MKNLFSIILVFAVFLLVIPAIALFKQPSGAGSSKMAPPEAINITEPQSYKMLQTSTNTVKEISLKDYLIGAVFAQMPASFEPETLKAQALLAHTYILRQHIKEQAAPTANLSGADFSDNTSIYQAYFTEEQAKKLYGDKYNDNLTKISQAVDAVKSQIITYNNEPIVSAFHSMSGGMTESAKIAWGSDVPYLQAVSSTGETTAEGFSEEKTITPDELSARLKQSFSGLTLGADKASWITGAEKSPSGTVISVKVGNLTLKGSEIKDALSLRSCYFDITFDGTNFKTVTKGYGHGVGLSQYGANAMAKQGKNYQEIIAYYFKGVKINILK